MPQAASSGWGRGRQGGARLGIRKDDNACGAAFGAAVARGAVLDLRVTRQAHKVRQARRVARPATARAGGAEVRVREVEIFFSLYVKADI